MQELAEFISNNDCYYVLLTSSEVAKLEIKEGVTEFDEIHIKVEKKSKYTFIVNNELEISKTLKNGEEIPEEPQEPEVKHKTEVPEGWIGIYNEEDLRNVANDITAKYILMANIALPNVENATQSNWTAIGNNSKPFTGYFDGNNYKISNLQIGTSKSNQDYQGLFGYINGSEISNLKVETSEVGVNGKSNVGGLLEYNSSGTIINTYSTGEVQGGDYVGGLVGLNAATITNSYTISKVVATASSYRVGLLGYASGGAVINSYWTKERSGQTSSAGGTLMPEANIGIASNFKDWDFKTNDTDTEYIWYMKNGLPELNI